MSTTVRLLAFAAARDALGAPEVSVPIDEVLEPRAGGEAVVTAEALLAYACRRFPALAPYRGCLRLAVNGTWADGGDVVRGGDEVALLPPVSGG